MLILTLLSLLIGNQLRAQCPKDIQPSCPIITNAVMDQTDNGNGTSDYIIYIDWIQGTANNASLQWDVYYGNIICPDEYEELGLFPVENCIHVHSGNSSGTIIEYLNNVPNTENIYLVAQGRTNASCGGNICNQTFVQVAPKPVPVKMVEFDGVQIDDFVLLEWTTESEIQNEGFVIESSQNSKDFVEIGFVQGNGTTTETKSYRFRSEFNSSSISYYRLKQIDYDGAFEYSEIINIKKAEREYDFSFDFYPNPIGSEVLIFELPELSFANIEVIDNTGKRIIFQNINGSDLQLNTSTWTPGLYNVIYRNSQVIKNKRLIKL